MQQPMFFDPNRQFDLARLTKWEVVHSDLVGQVILIEEVSPIETKEGSALLVVGKIIKDEKSFDEPSVSILVGATVLMSGIRSQANPFHLAFKIKYVEPGEGKRPYYDFDPIPEKLAKLIQAYSIQWYEENALAHEDESEGE